MRQIACNSIEVSRTPAAVLLVPWGDVESTKGSFLLDEAGGRAVLADFQEHGTDIPIDYEHQTLGGQYASPTGQAPAAGWIRGLRVVPNVGIYGAVEWTDAGRERVTSKEYRYLSPVVGVGPDGRVMRLHSAALTNKPAILNMQPIINSQAGDSRLAEQNKALLIALAAAYHREAWEHFFGKQSAEVEPVRTIPASQAAAPIAAAPAGGGFKLPGLSRNYFPPPAPVTEPTVTAEEMERIGVIGDAAIDYQVANEKVLMPCSRHSWIDQTLRDKGLPTMTAEERRVWGGEYHPPDLSTPKRSLFR